MLVHFGHDRIRAEWARSVVCIGTFDGIHLGHRELISLAVKRGRELECPSVVVTFDRHPAATLAPDKEPLPISTTEQNLALLRNMGISCVVVLPFDRAMAAMTAETFFDEVLREELKAEEMVVGHDFAFGHDRVGTTEWLSERIPTLVVQPFLQGGVRVSSSAIRQALVAGRLEEATTMLGRPFAIDGVVVAGQKLGRQLGYPTANLARSSKQVLPPDGIFAGYLNTATGGYLAAVNIGFRPTVEGKERTIEAFLLDYPGDSLYGQAVRLELFAHLRGEAKFDSMDALKAQMALDVTAVAEYGPTVEETPRAWEGLEPIW